MNDSVNSFIEGLGRGGKRCQSACGQTGFEYGPERSVLKLEVVEMIYDLCAGLA